MPIFDFKCEKCGNEFEKLVRKDEDRICPECQSKEIKQLVSTKSAGFILKGKGVYKNGTY